MCVHGNFSAVTIMNYIITDDSVLPFHWNSYIYIFIFIYIYYTAMKTHKMLTFMSHLEKLVFFMCSFKRGSLSAR